MSKVKKYIHKKIINLVSFIVSLALVLSAFGCQSYEITNADSLIYNRKSIFSSGIVKLENVKTIDQKIYIGKFSAVHSNGYFSLNVDATNVELSKEQLQEIIQK